MKEVKALAKHFYFRAKAHKKVSIAIIVVLLVLVLLLMIGPSFFGTQTPSRPQDATLEAMLDQYREALPTLTGSAKDKEMRLLYEFYLSEGKDQYSYVDVGSMLGASPGYILIQIFFRPFFAFSLFLPLLSVFLSPLLIERPIEKGFAKNFLIGDFDKRTLFRVYFKLFFLVFAGIELLLLVLLLLFGSPHLGEETLFRGPNGYTSSPLGLFFVWIALHSLIGGFFAFCFSAFVALLSKRFYVATLLSLALAIAGFALGTAFLPYGLSTDSIASSFMGFLLPGVNLGLLALSSMGWVGVGFLVVLSFLSCLLYRFSRRLYEKRGF